MIEPSRWGVAMALYMIGFISYGATLVFFAAAFPRLARNTARAREFRRKYESGEISKEEHDLEESLEKNRIIIFQQPRPGPPLPKGESYLTIGWKQIPQCMGILVCNL
ncbi:hypothetical protein C0989_001211 [Termitomyces sp. Mn162]|nr:hypothetical protein C0989_001211 [Termitomyces sp. Mn162]